MSAALDAVGSPASLDELGPAAGFVRADDRDGPFVTLIGPLYVKQNTHDEGFTYGIRIARKHANGVGTAHGGLLLTLADTALGDNLSARYGAGIDVVTVSLASDFALPAKVGDWVEAHVDVQRTGGRLCYANSYLILNGERIFRSSGVFAVLRPKKADA